MSPGKTICSLFSINCKKHDHRHHHEQNSISLINFSLKQEAYVFLERLELMTDPLVLDYLMKTDRVNEIKEDPLPIKTKITFDKSDTGLVFENQKQDLIHSNDERRMTKDDIPELNGEELSETNSKDNCASTVEESSEAIPSTSIESSDKISSPEPKAKRRRRTLSSRTSTESPSLLYRRKKRNVNYIDDYSDTDSDESSSTDSLPLKSLSQVSTFYEIF